ncbi:MAG TPA: hypothetical protein VF950_07685 [Planctomycetota bacterium]
MRELRGDWRDLFNGFMVALDLRKCFLALCGIALTIFLCGGMTIWLGNALDAHAVDAPRDLVLHKWCRAQSQAIHVIYKGTVDGLPPTAREAQKKTPEGVRSKHSHWIALGYSAAVVLTFLAIWSYFGGAIARIAAFEIAKDGERIETRKALQFAKRKFWSFFWAPLICVIGLLFFSFCNYVGGLVGHALDFFPGGGVGSIVVALLLPLALLSGFIMTLIGVGTMTGLPLFLPAVAAEGTDSFDAVSRGFSYVYSRPWHFLGYQGLSAVYGYVSIGFVILFSILMCHLGISAGKAGYELCGAWKTPEGKTGFQEVADRSWRLILSDEHTKCEAYRWDVGGFVKNPDPYGRLQTVANQLVHPTPSQEKLPVGYALATVGATIWLVVTLGLALGYVVSYTISQQTMIYYILRKKVDGIEMNEVFEEAEEEKPAAALEASKPAEGGAPPATKPEEKPPA